MVSPKPIVLWNSRKHSTHTIDDAGVAIKKSVLPPAVRAVPYGGHLYGRTFVGEVPPLAYFCIKALSSHVDQLHTLGHFRFGYRHDLLRALLPTNTQPKRDESNNISQCSVTAEYDNSPMDPRLWSTLAQVIHPLPEQLHDLELPLGDVHLPLLQQIPSTPHFSMVTLLALPNCNDVCDDTISELRRLNSLIALDLHGTRVSSYGVAILVRGLSWTESDAGSKRRTGLWGLRILRLHSCSNIDDNVLPMLTKFPLLSAIDLRFTRCTRAALRGHLGNLGFRPQCERNLFHPVPLSLALCTLEDIASHSSTPTSLYSCSLPSVFRIHVNTLLHSPASRATASARHPTCSTLAINLENSGAGRQEKSAYKSCVESTPFPLLRSSFYQSVDDVKRSGRSIRCSISTSAQSARSPDDGQADPLAVTRPPPSWETLGTQIHLPHPDANSSARRKATLSSSTSIRLSRQPPLGDPTSLAEVDRTRLSQRNAGAVNGMLDVLARKRCKVECPSSGSLQKQLPAKMHNPFAKSTKPVFAGHKSSNSEIMKPVLTMGQEASLITEFESRPDSEASSRKSRSKGIDTEIPNKPLKPITTLQVPVLPREFLPGPMRTSRLSSERKATLRQTRLFLPPTSRPAPPTLKEQKTGVGSDRKRTCTLTGQAGVR